MDTYISDIFELEHCDQNVKNRDFNGLKANDCSVFDVTKPLMKLLQALI